MAVVKVIVLAGLLGFSKTLNLAAHPVSPFMVSWYGTRPGFVRTVISYWCSYSGAAMSMSMLITPPASLVTFCINIRPVAVSFRWTITAVASAGMVIPVIVWPMFQHAGMFCTLK